MSTQNNETKSMTSAQILGAFIKSMRISDEMDATGISEGFERAWFRLDGFLAALGREVDAVAPELHNQLMAYRMRVISDENSLRTARQIADGQQK
jgi:hypothetical protein